MPSGILYRWEDHNHGLEHKCGTCATVLSSPRAKKTCFGIHEEVCIRYHKTLFFIGQSHTCEACRHSIEAHDKRHREIAAFIQDIQRLDGAEQSQGSNRKRQGKIVSQSKKDSHDSAANQELGEPNDEQDSIEGDDDASHVTEDEADERGHNWHENDARKAAKAERKAAKHQLRFDVITAEELVRVHSALHPEPKEALHAADRDMKLTGLVDNITIDKNIAFNSHTFKYSSLRQSAHAKKMMKNNGTPKNVSVVTPSQISTAILHLLGIRTKLTKASKERKILDNKLRSAIMSDLLAVENEQAEIMERMAGYWRYVNKRTYNQMIETNQVWDWATGQKLLKIEEESELESISEEDESTEDGTLDGFTPASTPMTSPRPREDNELLVGKAPSNDLTYIDDGPKTPTQASYAKFSADPDAFAEDTRRRFDELQLQRLSYSPGRSPGPTYNFHVPSPSSSDDDPYEWTWNGYDASVNQQSLMLEAHRGLGIRHLPDSPLAKASVFDGNEDNRSSREARFVREASPPQEKYSAQTNTWRNTPSPTTIPPTSTDINNLFGNLDRELPAPCEDRKKPEKVNLKSHITIMVPPKPVLLKAEPGWEVQAGPKKKNNKEYPALGGNKKKATPAVKNSAARRQLFKHPGGASTYADVAAGTPKKR